MVLEAGKFRDVTLHLLGRRAIKFLQNRGNMKVTFLLKLQSSGTSSSLVIAETYL